ncbi:MAG: NAD(P)H-binding protein, partial [Solirubrobacterales bacterium]
NAEDASAVAIAGATGYIGGLLARRLLRSGARVGALARRPEAAGALAGEGAVLHRADVLDRESLEAALDGAGVAYYLVHSMGRGSDADFAARDRRGAANFAAAAAATGVKRIVYLGGLGQGSEHLDSRHETARVLRSGEVPVTYFRAAAVIGAGSESFRTVLYLVKRLPAMLTPRWVGTRTQPIAIADAIGYLSAAADLEKPLDREIEIGGPDVTTYGGMMDTMARAMERRPPLRITVPVLTPRLSSLWIGLITPVDAGVAKPLIEGMSTETIVGDRSGMELFDVIPTPLEEAMKAAFAEEEAS